MLDQIIGCWRYIVAKKTIHFLVMASAAISITFKIEKKITRPKPIKKANTIYALYAPETIRIHPGEAKLVYLKFSVHVPTDILTTFLIMPNLKKEGLKLNHHTETNIDQRIRLEYINPTLKNFTLKKNSKIALFITLNEGNEIFKKRFEKLKKKKTNYCYFHIS